ncbi:Oxidoreductase molybdopterin binding domain protein [Roseibium album]|nr:Oxidoreductase molybdopterin binding domain protein [Roseibium album]
MLRILAGLILVLGLGSAATAEDIDKTVLTISGKISGEESVDLSIRQLTQLSRVSYTTSTPWHDGKVSFEGVLLGTLMKHVGATGENAEFIALNEYRSTLPVSDFKEHSPLLAYMKDGKYMTIRDKGPLFVIYPFDDKPELKTEVFFSRSVWQIRSIEFR